MQQYYLYTVSNMVLNESSWTILTSKFEHSNYLLTVTIPVTLLFQHSSSI